jgi:4-alpha-glucanotransferase
MLLHLTSLPGPEGIGCLGADARAFVDLLAAAGFDTWQVLPVNPPGGAFSPYAAESSFAGSPLLVSIAALAEEGLLSPAEAVPPPFPESSRVAPAVVRAWKEGALRTAFTRLSTAQERSIAEFAAASASWLDDWALFAALEDRYGHAWQEWPVPLVQRLPAALDEARRDLAPEHDYHRFVQWCFDRQWRALRGYAAARGVRIFGDMPIFVDLQSADVWANQGTFKLGGDGYPEVVTGVPPDAFSATGQRWGNPHYRWDAEAARGFPYWTARVRRAFELYDLLRIDHFRGFVAAWEIPAGEPTAVVGEWVPGPGATLFEALRAALGPLNIVVEDLGIITDDVRELRDALGYPGMIVLHFAFDGRPDNPYLPANHREDAVVYAGTHDNDTTAGWWRTLSEEERARVRLLAGRTFADPPGDLMALAMESPARLAVLTMQDVLRLGSEARMNRPGVENGNWLWRLRPGEAPATLAAGLRELAARTGRLSSPAPGG